MNIGVNNKRPARLNVCLGSDFTTASKRIKAYKFVDGSVLSGEPVIAEADFENGNDIVFKKVDPTTGFSGKAVYWAFSDYDKDKGRDFDNMAIKKLEALYSGDKFEITTPFFDLTGEYLPGTKLTLKAAKADAAEGQVGLTGVVVAPVEEGDDDAPVIGRVSDGVIALGGDGVEGQNITVAPTDTSADQFIVGGPRTYTNDTSSKFVLKFFTELA